MTCIEWPCAWTLLVHVHADPSGSLRLEPLRELAEQQTSNARAPERRGDVEILNLTVAGVAPSEVASDVADHDAVDRGETSHSRRQCLLRVMVTFQIGPHPSVGWSGNGIGVPARGHTGNISGCRAADLNTS